MKLNLKIHKTILQAILRGLNEALSNLSIDDFDDVEINTYKPNHEEINTHSGKEEYKKWKFIKDNFVDLGLPSGTLWAKSNLGASSPEESGDFYAWGETITKDEYTEQNYTPIQLEKLDDEHDVVYKSTHIAHIPTIEQMKELLKLPCVFTTLNDRNGLLVTGKNGNSLFIPAYGSIDGNYHHRKNDNKYATIWTASTLLGAGTRYVYCLSSNKYNPTEVSWGSVWSFGKPVRGVINKNEVIWN